MWTAEQMDEHARYLNEQMEKEFYEMWNDTEWWDEIVAEYERIEAEKE